MEKILNNSFPLLLCLVPLFFSGCKTDSQPLLPEVTGKQGEVAVVTSKKDWQSKMGEEFISLFSQPYEVLPQYEPVYDVLNVPHAAFGQLFQRHRNIIFTQVSPSYKKARVLVERDRYARSQLIIYVQAPDDSALVKLLRASQPEILSQLDKAERERLHNLHMKNLDKKLNQKLLQKHRVSLILPKGYRVERDSSDFTWVNQEIGAILQGIVIYQYPYSDSDALSPEKLVSMRDRFMKKYMPGEGDGSYMTTEKEFAPQFSEYIKGNKHMAEMRGLWKTEKGVSMGGPFISISLLDEGNKQVITVEGFVFAAGFNKRNYMRQLEAILVNMKFPS